MSEHRELANLIKITKKETTNAFVAASVSCILSAISIILQIIL